MNKSEFKKAFRQARINSHGGHSIIQPLLDLGMTRKNALNCVFRSTVGADNHGYMIARQDKNLLSTDKKSVVIFGRNIPLFNY